MLDLQNGVWNVFMYYTQFVTPVLQFKQDGKRPIEKELKVVSYLYVCLFVLFVICLFVCLFVLFVVCLFLVFLSNLRWFVTLNLIDVFNCVFQDYVKIAKWNDINFYAMKETVDKSHRTLNKFVRRYEVRFTNLSSFLIY